MVLDFLAQVTWEWRTAYLWQAHIWVMAQRDFYFLLSLDPVNIYNLKKRALTINMTWCIRAYFFAVIVNHLKKNHIVEGYWAKSWFYMLWMHLSFLLSFLLKAFDSTKCSTSCSMIVSTVCTRGQSLVELIYCVTCLVP